MPCFMPVHQSCAHWHQTVFLCRHMGTTVTGHRVVPVQVENVAGGMMLAGEGLSQAEFISTAKPHGVEIQATHEEGSRGARGNAAAVSAAQARAHSRAEEPVFISRLYAERDARDVWSQQPEASVQPHYKGPRDQHVSAETTHTGHSISAATAQQHLCSSRVSKAALGTQPGAADVPIMHACDATTSYGVVPCASPTVDTHHPPKWYLSSSPSTSPPPLRAALCVPAAAPPG